MTIHLNRSSGLMLVLAVGGLFLASCSSDGEAGSTPESTGVVVEASSEAASETPAEAPEVRFIVNTGGVGVGYRDACGGNVAGEGIREGAQVRVVAPGTNECEGWSLVEGEGVVSWVHVDYLGVDPPAAVASTLSRPPRSVPVIGSSLPQQQPPPPPPTTTGSFARLEKVIVYGEHLIPVSALEYRTPSVPRNPFQYEPQPGDYTCLVYHWHAAQPVRSMSGVVLSDPDPAGCGFGRGDRVETREILVP
jgi:hypothetical protein